jgi:hypothetical protein
VGYEVHCAEEVDAAKNKGEGLPRAEFNKTVNAQPAVAFPPKATFGRQMKNKAEQEAGLNACDEDNCNDEESRDRKLSRHVYLGIER